jgi:hypothetical protein
LKFGSFSRETGSSSPDRTPSRRLPSGEIPVGEKGN